jgi:SAM-dependent methyltransferase
VRKSAFDRRRRSFGAAAELYDRARPSYPPEAVGWMLGEAPRRVVDLGAGTGIFSRLVASLGHQVTAVEPDLEMRTRLAAASPGVTALEGSAEDVPLADGTADAVVAAQAFHWFDNHAARAEIARILASHGVFAPIWNVRDESVDWVAGLSRILEAGSAASAAVHSRPGRQFGPLFLRTERAEFRHSVPHTAETLLEVVRSRSAYLVAPPAEQRRIDERVRRLVGDLPEPFELPYVTVAFRAAKLADG